MRITSKGQVTIPANIREQAGLLPHTEVDFEFDGRSYRRRGGTKQLPLPDFLIGAHAAIAGYRLLTRDAARNRTYFPRLRLIGPN
jgi:AbrB family looped-hinge helix DNA binding protein